MTDDAVEGVERTAYRAAITDVVRWAGKVGGHRAAGALGRAAVTAEAIRGAADPIDDTVDVSVGVDEVEVRVDRGMTQVAGADDNDMRRAGR